MPSQTKRPKDRHAQEVDDKFKAATRAIEEGLPDRPALRQRRIQEARQYQREKNLLRGVRANNGDKWGNTWLRRKRFLEGKIERSERKARVARIWNGRQPLGLSWYERLGAVRSAEWPFALRFLAHRMSLPERVIFTKSSPAGKDEST